jgi:hypothetical protein
MTDRRGIMLYLMTVDDFVIHDVSNVNKSVFGYVVVVVYFSEEMKARVTGVETIHPAIHSNLCGEFWAVLNAEVVEALIEREVKNTPKVVIEDSNHGVYH